MELAQVRLLVTDFAGCYRYYRDVLGLKPQFEAEDGPYAKFTPDGGTAGIARRTARSWPGCWANSPPSRPVTGRSSSCGSTTWTGTARSSPRGEPGSCAVRPP